MRNYARNPEGLAVAGSSLFVSDKAQHLIAVYSIPGLHRVLTFGRRGSGAGELCDPSGLAVLGDIHSSAELVVCDVSNHRLQCFSLVGEYIRQIGRAGRAPGCFHLPTDVASLGRIVFVAERRRVQVLTSEGIPLQVIMPPTCGSLHGISARGVRLLVADSEMRRLHEFRLRSHLHQQDLMGESHK